MTDIVNFDTFKAELLASGITVDDQRAQRVLARAQGMVSDYCGRDLSDLSPIPMTIQTIVIDLAVMIYHAGGRDPAITKEQEEGVGSTSFGLSHWTDRMADLDPWRVFHVA